MAARRYEISLRVLKNISAQRREKSEEERREKSEEERRERSERVTYFFNTRREIPYLQAAM